jgi:hypothetical protein
MEVFKVSEKINEFVKNIPELTEEVAKAISDLVIKNIGELKIRITHDTFGNINKYKNMRTDLQEGRISEHVILEGISGVSDVVPGFKMILTSNRGTADYNIPLVRRCNGVILHVGEYVDSKTGVMSIRCKVLAIPSNDFTVKVDKQKVSEHLANDLYDIYTVNDGTTVTMYYDPNHLYSTIEEDIDNPENVKKIYRRGKWMYATKNAVDVDEMVWRDHTYGEVITSVMKKYPQFSFDKLDKNKSYTIGIRHPDYHPFGQPVNYGESGVEGHSEAWFIQSTDLVNGKAHCDEDIGLPLQRKHELQEFVSTSGTPLQNILNRAHASMEEFSRGVRMNLVSDKKVDPPVFLGVFLRSRDESKTRQYSDVLIESSLWVAIRQSVYQKPHTPTREMREKQEHQFKNLTYVILDAYLNAYKHKDFITLFPQFKSYYDTMDKSINTVCEMIFQEMQKGGKKKEIESNDNEKWLFSKLLPLVQSTYKTSDAKNGQSTSRSFYTHGGSGGRGDGGGRGERGGPGAGRGGRDGRDPGIQHLSVTVNDKKIIKTLMVHPRYTEIYFRGLYNTENRDVNNPE